MVAYCSVGATTATIWFLVQGDTMTVKWVVRGLKTRNGRYETVAEGSSEVLDFETQIPRSGEIDLTHWNIISVHFEPDGILILYVHPKEWELRRAS